MNRARAQAELVGRERSARQHHTRQMLVVEAIAVIHYAQRHGTKRPWLVQLLARPPPANVAAVALANKNARMVWALMTSGERYRESLPRAA